MLRMSATIVGMILAVPVKGDNIMAVTTRSGRTYQPTDLTTAKRRDFIEEARVGVARLRNSDGETLVALPERDLNALVELRDHALAFLSLENAMSRAREDRRSTDFGELAWATVLDDDDLAEFRAEFAEVGRSSIFACPAHGVLQREEGKGVVAELNKGVQIALRQCDQRLPVAVAQARDADPSFLYEVAPFRCGQVGWLVGTT